MHGTVPHIFPSKSNLNRSGNEGSTSRLCTRSPARAPYGQHRSGRHITTPLRWRGILRASSFGRSAPSESFARQCGSLQRASRCVFTRGSHHQRPRRSRSRAVVGGVDDYGQRAVDRFCSLCFVLLLHAHGAVPQRDSVGSAAQHHLPPLDGGVARVGGAAEKQKLTLPRAPRWGL